MALCVAAAGSDVARAHPGGCAVGGTALLPAGLARLAGLAHLVGRAAAGATAATVFGSYVLPSRPVLAAVGLVVVVTGLAVAGVTWTVRSAWALVGGVGVVLFVAVLVGLAGAGGRQIDESSAVSAAAQAAVPVGPASAGAPGLLTAAGLLFFAFVGFARLFPLGAQLPDPRRAVGLTLGVALLVHLAVAVALLCGLGVDAVATAAAPLAALVDAGGAPALGVLVRIGRGGGVRLARCWRCSRGVRAPRRRWPAAASCRACWRRRAAGAACGGRTWSAGPPRWSSSRRSGRSAR